MDGGLGMPVIARFYGIIIKMYFSQSEHGIPHFHAILRRIRWRLLDRDFGDVGGRFAAKSTTFGEGMGNALPERTATHVANQ
jgi:hypothetical protein